MTASASLTAYDSFCQLMIAYNSLQHFLTSFDIFWNLLTAFGSYWQLLTAFESLWQCITVCDSLWQLMIAFGSLLQFMTAFRTGTKWGFPNFLFLIKNSLVSFQPKFDNPYFLHAWPKLIFLPEICFKHESTSFTSTNVKLRLRFDLHLTFHWHSPEPHLTTWPSSDLPLTLTRPLPNLD